MRLACGILRTMATPLGDTVRRLRTDAHLSPEELATEAGVSRSTVYRIESGEIEEPDLPTLRGVARALQIPMSEMFHHIENLATKSRVIEEPVPLGPGPALSAGDRDFITQLVTVCLHAANVSDERAGSLFDVLAFGFAAAVDPSPEGRAKARRAVQSARAQRAERATG